MASFLIYTFDFINNSLLNVSTAKRDNQEKTGCRIVKISDFKKNSLQEFRHRTTFINDIKKEETWMKKNGEERYAWTKWYDQYGDVIREETIRQDKIISTEIKYNRDAFNNWIEMDAFEGDERVDCARREIWYW